MRENFHSPLAHAKEANEILTKIHLLVGLMQWSFSIFVFAVYISLSSSNQEGYNLKIAFTGVT